MGIKQTKQRERILEVIRDAHGHMTADEIYQELKKEQADIGVATVYRNVKYLFEHKMVNRIKHPDYGYVYDANLERHYHFHCQHCNKMYDIDNMYNESLNRKIEKEFGGKVYHHMTFFYGICPDCLVQLENDVETEIDN